MRTAGKGKFVGTIQKGIARTLRIPSNSLKIYEADDLQKHIKESGHEGDFAKYGSHLQCIVTKPHWFMKSGHHQYVFVRLIGEDYVYVPVHYRYGHLSVRSFYKKEDRELVQRLIRQRHLKPYPNIKSPDSGNPAARALFIVPDTSRRT
ncbi:hypothetical protein DVH26_05840 [Paenibacillus sp. H1-7]|uniref:PBECR3 domain-containing polyvalent protein n=1 Tax=Paenibacillus sp. H1-7 TaxID=2282849 RepID=UPI001EF8C828|nr:hypothetical protein [Paenibacillus sp. H1-7]ULL14010.1 hypothetical protein DVH26_05840 [Paenibacillus sp. H1-7]